MYEQQEAQSPVGAYGSGDIYRGEQLAAERMPIPDAYSDLELGINLLFQNFENLRNRLSPVLGPGLPNVQAVQPGSPKREVSSLAGSIRNDAGRIQDLNAAMVEMMSRIEL